MTTKTLPPSIENLRPLLAAADVDRVAGLALWFEKVPADQPVMGETVTLCGWVPAAREAELDGWISFLNAQITERLKEAPLSFSDRHFNASLAGFEALGLTMPKGTTADAVMEELEAAAKKKS